MPHIIRKMSLFPLIFCTFLIGTTSKKRDILRAMHTSILIIITGFISFVINLFWYSRFALGKLWRKYLISPDQENAAQENTLDKQRLLIIFLYELIIAFAFIRIALMANVYTLSNALELSSLIWLGFTVPLLADMALWNKKPWISYVIHSLHRYLSLLAIGIAYILLS